MTQEQFEQFVSSPPFERDIRKVYWADYYKDVGVDLAWECVKKANELTDVLLNRLLEKRNYD